MEPIRTRDFPLRPLQRDAVQAWVIGAGDRPYTGTVAVVTGGGKTLIALACIQEASRVSTDLWVAVVVPTIALAEQWLELIPRFYINEFHDVLVPDGSGGAYWAGRYSRPLEFNLDGLVISPAVTDIEPGDLWPGPHVGVAHKLKAGAQDIEYVQKLEGGRLQRSVYLSDEVGADAARVLAQRLGRFKGSQGGRIYINEAGNFFAPTNERNPVEYIFLGSLGDDAWFLPPEEYAD